MASPAPTTVMIECPHCGTRYELPEGTVGPKGRKVSCAHCGEAWLAKPLALPAVRKDDSLFDDETEADLDAAFAEAEAHAIAEDPERQARERTLSEIRAAIGSRAEVHPPAEPAKPATGLRKLQQDFMRRQAAANRRLPLAKVRRVARIVGVTSLVLIIVAGIVFRTEIVRRLPDLAGMYAALGLGVNVVGLEFRDVTTLTSVRNGGRTMRVDARIYSVAAQVVGVPRVRVTLLDEDGNPVYEWSAQPEVGTLQPGEVADFTTQLAAPPATAAHVRLSFTDGRAGAEAPRPAASTQTSEHHG